MLLLCSVLLLYLVHVPTGTSVTSRTNWSFAASSATDEQERLFGSALQQGWFGADLSLSVAVGPSGQYMWVFGDSYVGQQRSGGALCNGVAALTCAMVPQSVARSDGSQGLQFAWAGRGNGTSTPRALLPVPASLTNLCAWSDVPRLHLRTSQRRMCRVMLGRIRLLSHCGLPVAAVGSGDEGRQQAGVPCRHCA